MQTPPPFLCFMKKPFKLYPKVLNVLSAHILFKKQAPEGEKMMTKMMALLDGDGFDIVLEKVLKGMSFVIFAGCLPWFLYVTVRFFAG
ncbi:hypothetical protein C3733_09415 [Bacillus amyloliquefaciens]|nr:hypothetical protein C3733_09415 [Bacillus amyloliquefaciens]